MNGDNICNKLVLVFIYIKNLKKNSNFVLYFLPVILINTFIFMEIDIS